VSETTSTLRWVATSMVLAVVAIVALLVIGEVYGGTDVQTGATVNGEPGIEQLVGKQSGADVRNASVALGLLALAILVATYFYFRHTGRAARRRLNARRAAARTAPSVHAEVDTRVEPWPTPSTSTK
jgi:hypothetical protein